jgi:hypothetical protein
MSQQVPDLYRQLIDPLSSLEKIELCEETKKTLREWKLRAYGKNEKVDREFGLKLFRSRRFIALLDWKNARSLAELKEAEARVLKFDAIVQEMKTMKWSKILDCLFGAQ